MKTIDYARTRDVKAPKRGDGTPQSRSAGYDFFIPEFSPELMADINEKNDYNIDFISGGFAIRPRQRVLIPAGIKMNITKFAEDLYYTDELGIASIGFNKSGVSTKLGLDVLACVIDEDYQGEIHISIYNTSDEHVEINFGDKIIQFLFIPVLLPTLKEKSPEELFYKDTVRGEGGFGSTGTK
jgi:deoxyuridine 5'-triphosphate nucleotidohydrolase